MTFFLSTMVVADTKHGGRHSSMDCVRTTAAMFVPLQSVPPHSDTLGSINNLGSLLFTPPDVAPGGAPEGPVPDLSRLREHLDAGDLDRALRDAERIIEARWGRDRALASFVAGLIYRERGLHNLASESFTRVRLGGGPLAEWGSFYEAEQDRLRGKSWTAVRECETVRERWPEGRFDAACQRLMARALVEAGQTTRARTVADEHDEAFPEDAIREQIDLAIAHRWTDKHPELARPLLQKLAVEHEAPLTGRVAEALLAELRERGDADATMPDDVSSLQKRAISLRDAKRKQEAWSLFQELKARAVEDPSQTGLAAWVDGESARFAWRTHQWDALAAVSKARYDETGEEDQLWQHYKALDRGGRPKEALAIALQGQEKHGKTRTWRRNEEIIARTALLAKDYDQARTQLDAVAERGGWAGRRSAYTAGFAAYMAGDHEDAVARLTKVVDRNRGYVPGARYWRARSLEALGRTDEAAADTNWLLTEAPLDWYTFLVRQRQGDPLGSAGPPWERTGRWVDPPLPDLPDTPAVDRIASQLPVATGGVPSRPRVRPPVSREPVALSPLATLTWPLREAEPTPLQPVLAVADVLRNPALPPDSYRPSVLWDRDDGREILGRLASRHGDEWPEWIVARDLSDVGLYDVSGPVMSEIYETWREAWRNPRDPKHALARKIPSRSPDWRQMFYVTRDHHHADRFTYGSWDDITDPELKAEAYRLGWPLAHDHAVWTHARTEDVDPYLVMAIMRIESRYNAVATSHVGARGAMQIMPRTGRLLADLKGDEDFLSGDLEDPVFAVGYGIFYLGKLLDRFDGNTPLAVASYNGGPFNVHAWLQGSGDLPMDEFVEHIPFRETRGYVQKVSAAYGHYLALYEEPGTRFVLPAPPYADDPAIVDF